MENHFWANVLKRDSLQFHWIIMENPPTVIECVAIKRISLFHTEFCVNNICWQLKEKNAENVIFNCRETFIACPNIFRIQNFFLTIHFGSTIVTRTMGHFVKVPKQTIEFLAVDKDVQGINEEHRNIHRLSNWKFNWITRVLLS